MSALPRLAEMRVGVDDGRHQVLPVRSTRLAPCGIRTDAAVPTAVKRPPSTTKVAFSIWVLPSPMRSRAPWYAVTPLAAGA